MANPLVATAQDHTSPFAGTLLLEDGADLVGAINSGDWVSGGMAAFSAVLDTAAAVSDPLGTLIAAGLGWLIDHVEPLKGWFNDLTGNASEVQAFAQTWANIHTQMEAAGTELQRVLGDVEDLAGQAMDAYRRFQQDTAAHLAAAGTWAGAFSTGLNIASVIVQAVHDLVRDVLSQLAGSAISWASEAVFTLGLATPWIIEQVTTRVSSLVARVSKFVTNLLDSIKALVRHLDELKPLLDKASELFTKLLHGKAPKENVPVSGRKPELGAPPAHQGADAPQLPDLSKVDAEYRLPDGSVDPDRLDEWAQAVSDEYPGLTPSDVKGVYDYTTNPGYEAMNPFLRGHTQPDPADLPGLHDRITDTSSGIANLPAEPGRTYRGVTLNDDFLNTFQPGQKWHDDSFMSTSKDGSTADDFAKEAFAKGEVPGIVTVDGLNGSDVTALSRYRNEGEVLYQRGTEFEVVSKVQDAQGTWRIHLREVR